MPAKAINPLNCEGQIEGGVDEHGYALTEQYPLDHGKPTAKIRHARPVPLHQIPEIKATSSTSRIKPRQRRHRHR